MKKTDKQRFEHLQNILEIIQHDTGKLERNQMYILIEKAAVLGGQMKDLSEELKLKGGFYVEGEVPPLEIPIEKIFKWSVIPTLKILKESLITLVNYLGCNMKMMFPVHYTISWIPDYLIRQDESSGTFNLEDLCDRQGLGYTPLKVKFYDSNQKISMEKTEDGFPADFIQEMETCEEFIALANAMIDVPIEMIKRCENCENVFIQTTKREKRFCTTRCQNTAAVRKMREKADNSEGE